MFTNREIATVILVAAIFTLLLLGNKTRSAMLKGGLDVLKAFLVWRIQLVLWLYFAYIALAILAAWWIGAWGMSNFKDTIIWVLASGVPLLFGVNEMKDGKILVRSTVKSALGISAILAAYFSLISFSIPWEIALQVFVTFLVLMSLVAKRDKNTKQVGTIADVILAGIGAWLLFATTRDLVQQLGAMDWPETLRLLAMAVWMPLAMIPFLYTIQYVMRCEVILKALPFSNNRKKPLRRVRLAILAGLHFSPRYASAFERIWFNKVAPLQSFREARRVMKEFRKSVRDKAREEAERLARLDRYAGIDGVDDQGRRLDRREFSATQGALDTLFYIQMRQHRNVVHHYRDDVLEFAVLGKDLSPESFTAKVSSDKQRWYGWRRTITGWVFAIGGGPDLDTMWRFDGAEPPTSFPSASAKDGWASEANAGSDLNWGGDDA